MPNLQYGDKIIYMEGVVVRVTDGAVGVDLKGRLGYLEVPMRMMITDYPLKIGQEVGFNMSFIEQLSEDVNEHYVSNHMMKEESAERIRNAGKGDTNV